MVLESLQKKQTKIKSCLIKSISFSGFICTILLGRILPQLTKNTFFITGPGCTKWHFFNSDISQRKKPSPDFTSFAEVTGFKHQRGGEEGITEKRLARARGVAPKPTWQQRLKQGSAVLPKPMAGPCPKGSKFHCWGPTHTFNHDREVRQYNASQTIKFPCK